MKKGFTLLELIVVIIILGVLATLGLTQYQRMIERSRGAEARQILGSLRTHAAALYMQDGNCSNCNNGTIVGTDYPSTVACNPGYYFYYTVVAGATTPVFTATRCIGGAGKTPSATTANTVILTSNLATGADNWTTSGGVY